MSNTGTENYGGPVVTAGGLLFIGATNHDRKFHAYDKATGELLWETLLPFAATRLQRCTSGRAAVRGDCSRRREVGRAVRRDVRRLCSAGEVTPGGGVAP